MLIGGEDLLAPARLSPPVPARRDRVVRARGRGDGRQRADPVPRRAHGRRHRQGGRQPVAARDSPWRGAGVLRLAFSVARRLVAGTRVARRRVRPAQPDVRAPPVARARASSTASRPGSSCRARPSTSRRCASSSATASSSSLQSAITIVIAAVVMFALDPGLAAVALAPDAVRDLDRLPLRHAQPARHPGGAAAHRRADRGGRGEHRRRARGEGVRAGAAPAAPLQRGGGAGLRPVDGLHAAARLLLAVHRLPPPARAGRAAARGRTPGDQRQPSRSASSSRSTATC